MAIDYLRKNSISIYSLRILSFNDHKKKREKEKIWNISIIFIERIRIKYLVDMHIQISCSTNISSILDSNLELLH